VRTWACDRSKKDTALTHFRNDADGASFSERKETDRRLCRAVPNESWKRRWIPAEFMLHAHHWLILHGRYACLARQPRCKVCLINDLCRWPKKTV
jgi:endonuclease III